MKTKTGSFTDRKKLICVILDVVARTERHYLFKFNKRHWNFYLEESAGCVKHMLRSWQGQIIEKSGVVLCGKRYEVVV